MRWTLLARRRCALKAYGQAVWSRHLDAGVKLRNAICAATGANKPDTPGRARSSRSTIVQGMPCDFGQPVVTMLVGRLPFSAHEAAGAPAPGIPCALRL